MPAPINPFKAGLKSGQPQIGLWMCMADSYAAEITAGAGYDWLVIDGEHSPNDLRSTLRALQAMAAKPVSPVVRVPIGKEYLIKQVLDLGAQNILVPMVETADQARDLVRAVRYPPHGRRGVGAIGARATDFGRVADYITTADAQICLIVQVESRAGLAQLDEIAAVEGVDGVFIGPADLSTDMGFAGQTETPEVLAVIYDALARIQAQGCAAGILTIDPAQAQIYLDKGAVFVAVGMDVNILVNGLQALRAKFGAV
ncbi:MAG: aldolase/citrate lyase family protein [Rhodobacteraceae bacterium]|nr:aldolase/citrate lyase family protein [Paracoccaceae bacterium]